MLYIHSKYREDIVKAEKAAMTSEERKAEKKVNKPQTIPEPKIDSNFIMFFINLMNIKKILFKYGYGQYWKKWDLLKLSDIALILFVKRNTL